MDAATQVELGAQHTLIVDSQYSLFSNQPLLAAFICFTTAQFLKVLITWHKEKRWDARRLLGSGGMPSSHAATVMGLAASIGLNEGMNSPLFAISIILAGVVMYDASGVRMHAGRQAEVLNQIVIELPSDHPLSDCKPLHELLGHTPSQVMAGALLGCVISSLLHIYSGSGSLPK